MPIEEVHTGTTLLFNLFSNDILRFFFPKGYDFHSLDNETLQNIVLSINLRPKFFP